MIFHTATNLDLPMSSQKTSLIRHAKLAGWACRFTAVAIPALLFVAWYLGTAQLVLFARLDSEAIRSLGMIKTGLAMLLSLLPVLALARSLFHVATCFDCFAGTEWFGSTLPLALGKAGTWLIICGLCIFVVPTLIGLVLTWGAEAGQRALTVSLSGDGLLAILFGSLLWSLDKLWVKANELAADNARYV